MANVYKNIEIVGTVGNVYELRQVGKDNRSVIDFSVAVTPRTQVDGEWTDKATIWTNCTAWGRLADSIAEGWKSGDRVIVRGRADMKDGYTNKDGVEVPAREILIVEFAGHEDTYSVSTQERKARNDDSGDRPQRQSRPAQKAAPKRRPAPAPVDDDDLDLGLDDLDGADEDVPF